MRVLLVAALLMLVPMANAEFGGGPVTFREYEVGPGLITDAPEPTIGIPWNTDSIFYQAFATTIKGTWDGDEPTWSDVTPATQPPINLDPLLVADEDTGRVFAGGLLGACSIMHYSDDDGLTWLPSVNMCSGAQFDHQSMGIGPKPVIGNPMNLPQLQNAYYCGQLLLIGCSVSLDGGNSWTAPTPAVIQFAGATGDNDGQCGSFHGHWRISRVTGTAFLPVPACGEGHGMLIANVAIDGTQAAGVTGLTFEGRNVDGSHEWNGGFDSSIGISRDAGWLYYGQADHMGARIGLSHDEGLSWQNLPSPKVGQTTWLDVGQFHDPPVVMATFADVQSGDDDRVAFTFLGLEDLDGDGLPVEYGSSRALYNCEPTREDGLENRVWHYYAAFSYDAGQNWTVDKLTDHPVQIGGIWDGGGGNPCRNLLDFNDMDIDSTGRVHIAWADGCVGDCLNDEGNRYSQAPRLFRQTGGMGLFSQYDVEVNMTAPVDTDGDGIPDAEDEDPFVPATGDEPVDEDAPGLGLVALLMGIALVALVRRK